MSGRRLLAGLLILVAIPIVWTWWNSDRRQIERRIDELQELVSKSGGESALEGLAAARAVTSLFATDFEVRAEQLRFATRSRQDLIGFIHQHRATSDRIDMRIEDSSLSITPEHGRATQIASFKFLSGGPLGSSTETYRVQVNWLQQEGRWVIDYINLLEIVDLPPGGLRF